MVEVGIIGLDTSHAEEFAELLSERPDAVVGGVWDGADVRDDAYVEGFCETYGARRFDHPEAMIDAVDAAMVLSVDWDLHRRLAEPFLEAGVPTFVDKPVAGTAEDVRALAATVDRTGTSVFGGSAVPYHPDLAPMRADGGTHDLFASGHNGSFYYGVHLVDTVRRICGADWSRVEPSPHRRSVAVSFADGSAATIRFEGPADDGAFAVLDVGDSIRSAHIGGTEAERRRMYDPLVERFLEVAAGERDPPSWLFDAATLLLATQAVLDGADEVTPDCRAIHTTSVDGTAFSADYAPLY